MFYFPGDAFPFRLFSERQILARGLAHPIVFMGRTTPRALDGVVDGVVKSSEEQSKNDDGEMDSSISNNGSKNESKDSGAGGQGQEKDENGMQTFFTKVRQPGLDWREGERERRKSSHPLEVVKKASVIFFPNVEY